MLFKVIEWFAVVLSCTAASIICVHRFQLDRYQLPQYTQWLKRHFDTFLRKYILAGFLTAMLSWYLPVLLSLFISVEEQRMNVAGWMSLVVYLIIAGSILLRDLFTPMKKPLVLTMRARRLFCAIALLNIILTAALNMISLKPYLAYALVPYLTGAAGWLMRPIEEKINAGFYEQARKKLYDRKDLIRIGITGSCGKTLTKFILRELLSEKYEVLATPASFNTAMGISRVVNDQLEDKHQVFIAEMGAQHKGDIRYLTKLVRPKYGLITSIGAQHLDTFGSMANIVDTKYELISGLPKDGAAFFSSGSGYSDRLYSKCGIEKYKAVVDQEGEFYMRASGLRTTKEGTSFLLECSDGKNVRCKTRLFGHYNVQNIALSAAVARKMGLTMEEIARGIARLQPFERRLQLISGKKTIIDDTLNDTALGTAEALNVLSEFPGRRVIVTPGLPKKDAKDDDINYAFGVQMRGCVDTAILVGEKKQVSSIVKGLRSGDSCETKIFIVADLDDAEDLLEEISGPDDVVLYECQSEE